MAASCSARGGPRSALNLALLAAVLPLILALAIRPVRSAPVHEEDERHQLEPYAEGCYYNYQHYGEGDRIITNEPCLNCTCHNRMLMCYLRVCPFTKAIGQDCTVEKKPDQCCPVITCPEVPVTLLSHPVPSTTSRPSSSGSTAVGHPDNYGCSIKSALDEEERFYPDGAQVPTNPENPCELCYCIRNRTACVMQECTLNVEGCKPVYQPGVCCPTRYECDYPEDGTTPSGSGGLILTTTTTASPNLNCRYNDEEFADGALIHMEDKPCEHCYCMRGDIVCAVQECGTPLEKEGHNCTALPPQPGKCCPEMYQCDSGIEYVMDTTSRMHRKHYGNTVYDSTSEPSIAADDTEHQEAGHEAVGAGVPLAVEADAEKPQETVTEQEEVVASTGEPIHEQEKHPDSTDQSTEAPEVLVDEPVSDDKPEIHEHEVPSTDAPQEQETSTAAEPVKEAVPETNENEVPSTDAPQEQETSTAAVPVKESQDIPEIHEHDVPSTEAPQEQEASTDAVPVKEHQNIPGAHENEVLSTDAPQEVETSTDASPVKENQDSTVSETENDDVVPIHDEKPTEEPVNEKKPEETVEPAAEHEQSGTDEEQKPHVQEHVESPAPEEKPQDESISASTEATSDPDNEVHPEMEIVEMSPVTMSPDNKPEVDNQVVSDEVSPPHDDEKVPVKQEEDESTSEAVDHHDKETTDSAPEEQDKEVTDSPAVTNDTPIAPPEHVSHEHDDKPSEVNVHEQDADKPAEVEQTNDVEQKPAVDSETIEHGNENQESATDEPSAATTVSAGDSNIQHQTDDIEQVQHEPVDVEQEHVQHEPTDSEQEHIEEPTDVEKEPEHHQEPVHGDNEIETVMSTSKPEEVSPTEAPATVSETEKEDEHHESEHIPDVTTNTPEQDTGDATAPHASHDDIKPTPEDHDEHVETENVTDHKPEVDTEAEKEVATDKPASPVEQEVSTDSSVANIEPEVHDVVTDGPVFIEEKPVQEQSTEPPIAVTDVPTASADEENVVSKEPIHPVDAVETHTPDKPDSDEPMSIVETVTSSSQPMESDSLTHDHVLGGVEDNKPAVPEKPADHSTSTVIDDHHSEMAPDHDEPELLPVEDFEEHHPQHGVALDASGGENDDGTPVEVANTSTPETVTKAPEETDDQQSQHEGVHTVESSSDDSKPEEDVSSVTTVSTAESTNAPQGTEDAEVNKHSTDSTAANIETQITTEHPSEEPIHPESGIVHEPVAEIAEPEIINTERPGADIHTGIPQEAHEHVTDAPSSSVNTDNIEEIHTETPQSDNSETVAQSSEKESDSPVTDITPENVVIDHSGTKAPLETATDSPQPQETETSAPLAHETPEGNFVDAPENMESTSAPDTEVTTHQQQSSSTEEAKPAHDEIKETVEEISPEVITTTENAAQQPAISDEQVVDTNQPSAEHDAQVPHKPEEEIESAEHISATSPSQSEVSTEEEHISVQQATDKPEDHRPEIETNIPESDFIEDMGESDEPEHLPTEPAEHEPESTTTHKEVESATMHETNVEQVKEPGTDNVKPEEDHINTAEHETLSSSSTENAVTEEHKTEFVTDIPETVTNSFDSEQQQHPLGVPLQTGDDESKPQVNVPIPSLTDIISEQHPAYQDMEETNPDHFPEDGIESEFKPDEIPVRDASTVLPTTTEAAPAVELAEGENEHEKHPEGATASADDQSSSSEEVTEAGDTDETTHIHQKPAEEELPPFTPDEIPGEGSCLVDGQRYESGHEIPTANPCQESCVCKASIVHCSLRPCSPPPSNKPDCMPVMKEGACCPVYTCVDASGHPMEQDGPVGVEGITSTSHEQVSSEVPSTDRPEESHETFTEAVMIHEEAPKPAMPEADNLELGENHEETSTVSASTPVEHKPSFEHEKPYLPPVETEAEIQTEAPTKETISPELDESLSHKPIETHDTESEIPIGTEENIQHVTDKPETPQAVVAEHTETNFEHVPENISTEVPVHPDTPVQNEDAPEPVDFDNQVTHSESSTPSPDAEDEKAPIEEPDHVPEHAESTEPATNVPEIATGSEANVESIKETHTGTEESTVTTDHAEGVVLDAGVDTPPSTDAPVKETEETSTDSVQSAEDEVSPTVKPNDVHQETPVHETENATEEPIGITTEAAPAVHSTESSIVDLNQHKEPIVDDHVAHGDHEIVTVSTEEQGNENIKPTEPSVDAEDKPTDSETEVLTDAPVHISDDKPSESIMPNVEEHVVSDNEEKPAEQEIVMATDSPHAQESSTDTVGEQETVTDAADHKEPEPVVDDHSASHEDQQGTDHVSEPAKPAHENEHPTETPTESAVLEEAKPTEEQPAFTASEPTEHSILATESSAQDVVQGDGDDPKPADGMHDVIKPTEMEHEESKPTDEEKPVPSVDEENKPSEQESHQSTDSPVHPPHIVDVTKPTGPSIDDHTAVDAGAKPEEPTVDAEATTGETENEEVAFPEVPTPSEVNPGSVLNAGEDEEVPKPAEEVSHVPEGVDMSLPDKESEMPQYPDPLPEDDEDSLFAGFPGSIPETDYSPAMPSYEDGESQASFGPGTCRYGGKVYVSAQQIPRDDPCDFCFCFRSDIICLQQSCPPPIRGCHEETIEGFCCPRYECPVTMGLMNRTTTTTTTQAPDLASSYLYARQNTAGCLVQGSMYAIGEEITTASGPCLDCRCGGDSKMKCEPKACSPQPMLRKMIEAVSLRRRR